MPSPKQIDLHDLVFETRTSYSIKYITFHRSSCSLLFYDKLC